VLHLNVKNGQVFGVGTAPRIQCTVTDKYSPITTQPTLKITGHSARGLGRFTAACSGATDQAGLTASPVSVTYWVAYGFGGWSPGKGVIRAHSRTLKVRFDLTTAAGQPISAATGRAMVRRHDARVTLRGPGIRPATAICAPYSARHGFVCKLRLPHGIETGRHHHYLLTAYESNGFVIAPGEPTAENPVSIHFR
jgi:hypothetical protein